MTLRRLADLSLYVVDTNVWIVAVRGDTHGQDCPSRSRLFVRSLLAKRSRIAVDQNTPSHPMGIVREEYRGAFRRLPKRIYQQSESYRVFEALFRGGSVLYQQIRVVDGIAEICNELRSVVHDDDDRKFVAVALSFSTPPPIVNATDSGWVGWTDALRNRGIEVLQLCPELFDCSHESAKRSP